MFLFPFESIVKPDIVISITKFPLIITTMLLISTMRCHVTRPSWTVGPSLWRHLVMIHPRHVTLITHLMVSIIFIVGLWCRIWHLRMTIIHRDHTHSIGHIVSHTMVPHWRMAHRGMAHRWMPHRRMAHWGMARRIMTHWMITHTTVTHWAAHGRSHLVAWRVAHGSPHGSTHRPRCTRRPLGPVAHSLHACHF